MTAPRKPYDYATAEESRKPGYLARRFSRIRAEQKAIADKLAEQQASNDAEAQAKVQPIAPMKRAGK